MSDGQLVGFLFFQPKLIGILAPPLPVWKSSSELSERLSQESTQESLQIKDNSQLFDCVIFFPCQQWLPLIEKFLCAKL